MITGLRHHCAALQKSTPLIGGTCVNRLGIWISHRRPNHGYNNFLAALVAGTQAFDGQVVLVHGDTHFFKVDKPLINQANLLENFTRLETFGSPNIHWVKVTVDPSSRNIFTFEPMIVPGN